jgi:phenylpropionate dioxygenase-like ring-hydroxylating dioxygenase large terminal subunit
MAPLVEIELAVGGKIRSNYNPEGHIGDATTIENTILSFDPRRMLSLKATRFPEGSPFAEVAKETWSVFRFSEVAPGQTKITVIGLGYDESEESRQMRRFFARANEQSLANLKRALEEEGSEEKGD